MIMRVRLVFPDALVREPILARLSRSFEVEPNVRRASIQDGAGWIVGELAGTEAELERAVAWLGEQGVQVERLADVVES